VKLPCDTTTVIKKLITFEQLGSSCCSKYRNNQSTKGKTSVEENSALERDFVAGSREQWRRRSWTSVMMKDEALPQVGRPSETEDGVDCVVHGADP
jgi:hypothetical protein